MVKWLMVKWLMVKWLMVKRLNGYSCFKRGHLQQKNFTIISFARFAACGQSPIPGRCEG